MVLGTRVLRAFRWRFASIQGGGSLAQASSVRSMGGLLAFVPPVKCTRGGAPTRNRDMARYSGQPDKAEEARDFVRTIEGAYWAIGAAIGIAVYSAAPFIAAHWIKAGSLQEAEVRHAVRIMGALAALPWPPRFHHTGLLGWQGQVLLNAITIASTGLASFGAVLVLWRVSPS